MLLGLHETFTILNLIIPYSKSTEEHQPMPLNVQISSDQICIVINIKALSGIKGLYFEVHVMVLDIRLALYCPTPPDYMGRVLSATVGTEPCRS